MALPFKNSIFNATICNQIKKEVATEIAYTNRIISQESKDNRDSDLFEVYMDQYSQDKIDLIGLRNSAMNVLDLCNKALFNLSAKEIYAHIQTVNPEDLEGIEWKDED